MPQHVTRVVVTQGEPDEHGVEPWRVEWTWRTRGRDRELRQTHSSRTAARRHVNGLLADLAPGLSRDDVLTLNVREREKPPR